MTKAAGAMIPEARKVKVAETFEFTLPHKRTVFPPVSGERLGKSPNPRDGDYTDMCIPPVQRRFSGAISPN
jgi:hypothetical protein